MRTKTFIKTEYLAEGWKSYKKNPILLSFLTFLILYIPIIAFINTRLTFITLTFISLVKYILKIGLIRISLNLSEEQFGLSEFLAVPRVYLRFFLGKLILSLGLFFITLPFVICVVLSIIYFGGTPITTYIESSFLYMLSTIYYFAVFLVSPLENFLSFFGIVSNLDFLLEFNILILSLGPLIYTCFKVVAESSFFFFRFLISEGRYSTLKALSMSNKISSGHRNTIFYILIKLIFLNISGGLFLGIGLLITIPVSLMTLSYIYKKLLSESPDIK